MKRKWNIWARRVICALFLTLSLTGNVAALAAEAPAPAPVHTVSVQTVNRPMLLTSGAENNDVVDKITNIKDIISGIITGLGAIVALVGLFMLAKSFASHDPSERTRALEFIVGGLVAAFAPSLLDLIMA